MCFFFYFILNKMNILHLLDSLVAVWDECGSLKANFIVCGVLNMEYY